MYAKKGGLTHNQSINPWGEPKALPGGLLFH